MIIWTIEIGIEIGIGTIEIGIVQKKPQELKIRFIILGIF